MTVKKFTVKNAADVVEVTAFNGSDAMPALKARIEEIVKHFSMEEPPKDFQFDKSGSYLIGNENDLYFIEVEDTEEEAQTLTVVEEVKTSREEKLSTDLEFTDSEEKGFLLEVIADAIVKSTGGEMKGALRANFEAWAAKNEKTIDALVGQTKVNGFKLTPEMQAEFKALDEAAGLKRPDLSITPTPEAHLTEPDADQS